MSVILQRPVRQVANIGATYLELCRVLVHETDSTSISELLRKHDYGRRGLARSVNRAISELRRFGIPVEIDESHHKYRMDVLTEEAKTWISALFGLYPYPLPSSMPVNEQEQLLTHYENVRSDAEVPRWNHFKCKSYELLRAVTPRIVRVNGADTLADITLEHFRDARLEAVIRNKVIHTVLQVTYPWLSDHEIESAVVVDFSLDTPTLQQLHDNYTNGGVAQKKRRENPYRKNMFEKTFGRSRLEPDSVIDASAPLAERLSAAIGHALSPDGEEVQRDKFRRILGATHQQLNGIISAGLTPDEIRYSGFYSCGQAYRLTPSIVTKLDKAWSASQISTSK